LSHWWHKEEVPATDDSATWKNSQQNKGQEEGKCSTLNGDLISVDLANILLFYIKCHPNQGQQLIRRWNTELTFLRPHRTILQNIICCWIFNTMQAVVPSVGVASWY